MIDTSAIGGASATGMVGSAMKRADLSRDQFISILIAQLRQQDPLKPVDNGEFLSQLVDLQNLETTSTMNDSFSMLIKQQEIGAASALIGKQVIGLTEDGDRITGSVDRVRIAGDDVRLIVGAYDLSLSNVEEIRESTTE